MNQKNVSPESPKPSVKINGFISYDDVRAILGQWLMQQGVDVPDDYLEPKMGLTTDGQPLLEGFDIVGLALKDVRP